MQGAGLLQRRQPEAEGREVQVTSCCTDHSLKDCCYTSWMPTLCVYIVTFNTITVQLKKKLSLSLKHCPTCIFFIERRYVQMCMLHAFSE